MDARERLLTYLRTYAARHPLEVTEAMLARWSTWVEECWQRMQGSRGDQVFSEPDALPERKRIAAKYLKGSGIEIGALHNPLPVQPGTAVRYVDKVDIDYLRLLYYEVSNYRLVDADVVDDGRFLQGLGDESVDFVISNHFLEHSDDPVTTLVHHLRVLRGGGVLYLAVPDCRKTFDATRQVTPLAHVWRDYEEGPDWSRAEHYRDWAVHVNGRSDAELEPWWRLLDAVDFSIHFHVWRPTDLLDLLLDMKRRLGLAIDVREFVQHANESVAIVEKLA